MLTGKPPFAAATSMQVMFAHCSAPIPNPADLTNVPESVTRIMAKAMAKNPPDRYEGAKEMLADLRAALGNGPIAEKADEDAMMKSSPAIAAPTVGESSVGVGRAPLAICIRGGGDCRGDRARCVPGARPRAT